MENQRIFGKFLSNLDCAALGAEKHIYKAAAPCLLQVLGALAEAEAPLGDALALAAGAEQPEAAVRVLLASKAPIEVCTRGQSRAL